MMKLLLLAVILLTKVLITKGVVALVFTILSFIFKGNQLHKSTLEWDKYFLKIEFIL